MREMSGGFECSYGKLSPYGFILNSTHGVLVGMVIKPSGQVAHTNHLCGPELLGGRFPYYNKIYFQSDSGIFLVEWIYFLL